MTEAMKLETTDEALRNALAWYGEQARLARLNHSEGDPGRWALSEDGGKRAREVLALSASPAGVVKDEVIAAIISDNDAPDTENIVLAQQGIAAGFDNHSVNQFAFAMRAKLAKKREEGRGGWHDKEYCSGDYLSRLLREHVEKGDPVDVANFCMMLHQRGERIMSAIEPADVGVETPPPSTHVAGPEPVGFGCFDKGLLFATFYDRSSAEAEARMHQDTEVHPIFRHPPSTTEGQDND